MLVLHRLKNQDIPYERDTSVDSSVSFQLGSTRGVDESTLDFYGGNESDEQPIVNGVPTHTTALSRSSQSHYVLQWPEISWETQRITIGLFALFTFFTGPSGVLALYVFPQNICAKLTKNLKLGLCSKTDFQIVFEKCTYFSCN